MVPQGIDLVIIPKKQAIFYNNPQIFEDLFLLGSKITRYVESQQ
jgi:RNase P protein component